MNAVVRKAKQVDFDSIMNLFPQLWPDKELNDKNLQIVFERGLASGMDSYFCAEINGKVVGFCAYAVVNNFWQEGFIAYVYAMVVDGELRGKGIGTQLMDCIFEEAHAKGCKKIELDSGFHREKAHLFYENIGFQKRAYLFSRSL